MFSRLRLCPNASTSTYSMEPEIESPICWVMASVPLMRSCGESCVAAYSQDPCSHGTTSAPRSVGESHAANAITQHTARNLDIKASSFVGIVTCLERQAAVPVVTCCYVKNSVGIRILEGGNLQRAWQRAAASR